jgi:hypothetical protein
MKKLLFFSFIALVSVFTFSCKKNGNNMHTIKYTIQGTGTANVTYVDQGENVQTVNNADANWTVGFSSDSHGLVLKLTAISNDGTPVLGKILIDGKESVQSNGTDSNITIATALP